MKKLATNKQLSILSSDLLLLSLVFTLLILGLFFQLSASAPLSEKYTNDNMLYFKQHLTFLLSALALGALTFTYYSKQTLQKYSNKMAVLAFIIITITLFVGYQQNGVMRWLSAGDYQIRTFPIALFLFIIFLSQFFASKPPTRFFEMKLLPLFFLMPLVASVLSVQPDINALILLSMLLLIMSVAAKWYKLSILVALLNVLIIAPLFIFSSYRLSRLMSYLSPFDDPLGVGYQLVQSLTAIAGGNFWGVGFGSGIIKTQLPNAHETFVLAVMSEEVGVFAVLIILLISAVISYRCFNIFARLKKANKKFEAMLVLALTSTYALFCAANIAVICGLSPVEILFPLISHGGEYLIFFVVAFSLILRIDAQQRTQCDGAQASEALVNANASGLHKYVRGAHIAVVAILGYSLTSIALSSNEANDKYQDYVYLSQHPNPSSVYKDHYFDNRGVIFDRKGRILAVNIETTDIGIDPLNFDVRDPRLHQIIDLLHLNKTDTIDSLMRHRNQKTRYRYLKRGVDIHTARLINDINLPGLHIASVPKRHYPLRAATLSLLGLTNTDNIGIDGIERAQNETLSANTSLQLTIDSKLQKIAHESLAQAIIGKQSQSGSTVVVNTDTGEILAMANYPSSDPADRQNMVVANIRNNAAVQLFEPSTLVNPFIMLAAYDRGKLATDTLVNTSPGMIKIEVNSPNINKTITVQDTEDYGQLSLLELATRSQSAVGMVKLAQMTPARKLYDVLSDANFDEKTNLGIVGEPTLKLQDSNMWSQETLLNIALGKGFMTTPVQLLQAYMAFMNEGKIRSLALFSDSLANQSHRTIMSKEVAQSVKEALRIAIESNLQYALFGKSTVVSHSATIEKDSGSTGIFVGFAQAQGTNLGIITTITKPTQEASVEELAKQVSMLIADKGLRELHE